MKHPLRSAVTTTGRRMAGARSLWRANGMREEQFGRPIIGIANSFTQLVPGHVHLHEIGQQVKQRIEACGCFAAEFDTIAVDDGIAMGHDGMLYSLPSREIIADSVEYMANAHCIDALVCISNCDKITPGMLMAAMRLNIPTVFVSGGPMEAGKFQGRSVDLIDAMVMGADETCSDAQIAEIALAQITSANIEAAHIDWANIAELNAAIARIAVAQLTTANINHAEIDWAGIGELQAAIAELTHASIGTADIDWAQIKDLTTGTAIIEKGVNGKLYVADLAVTEANMASLTVGELIVKGAGGCFYALSIAEDGTVTTEKKSVGDADIGDNSVSGGKLIEKTITARELNVASIFADEALVGAITAANIDVSSLFAAEAFISQLNAVDISGNESLRLVVETARDEALDATGEAVAQIALTAEEIRSEVRRDYASADAVEQLQTTVSTLAEQTESNFTWAVTKINEVIEDAAASQALTEEQLALIRTYMSFGEDGLTIGKSGNPLTFRVVNDRLAFYMNDTEVAYLSDNKLYVTQAEILARLQIGKFAYEPQSNGNLSVIYTG